MSIPIHPFSGTTVKNYWNLLSDNKFDIDLKYFQRVLYTSLVSTFATTPISKIETHFYGKAIQESTIDKVPLFIIGHWRSGTTFLHYLLSKDKQFGYLNNAQSFCPGYMKSFLPDFVQQIIGLHLPKKRPMDEVELTLSSPQEEEFALQNISEQSCYHWWTFPNRMQMYFDKYALLKDLKKSEYQEFKLKYLRLLKKISLVNDSKRLLMKNPINTGRIPLLLELFPNAQFIYLHREPIDVFHSTLKLHMKLLDCFSFQRFNQKEIEAHTLYCYQELIKKYEKDKTLILNNNLIEIKYQTLIENPLKTVEQIYQSLQIPSFEKSLNAFQDFIDSQQNYRADTYVMSQSKEAVLKKALIEIRV